MFFLSGVRYGHDSHNRMIDHMQYEQHHLWRVQVMVHHLDKKQRQLIHHFQDLTLLECVVQDDKCHH